MASPVAITERRTLADQTRRITRKPRFPFGVSMAHAELTPINYLYVLPGETLVSQKHQLRMLSEPVKRVLNPAYFELWTFYVPFRLALGKQWIEFVEQEGQTLMMDVSNPANGYVAPPPDVAGTTPVYNQEAKKYGFKNNAGATTPKNRNSVIERCAEVVYNYWFKYQDAANSTFQYGPNATHLPKLAHVDQLGESTAIAALPSSQATVTGGILYISDLKLAEDRYRKELNMGYSDPRYEEVMRAYGADMPVEANLEPELLLKRRNFLYPAKTVGQTNGNLVGQYQHDMDVTYEKPFKFNEHGLVMSFVTLRPEVLLNKYGPLPAYFARPRDFIMPTQTEYGFGVTAESKQWMANVNFDQVDLGSWMHLGEHFVGDVEPVGTKIPPVSVGSLGSDPAYPSTDTANGWDLPNFQFTDGTDAEKLRRVAWATGVSSFRVKTAVQALPNNRTLEKDRR